MPMPSTTRRLWSSVRASTTRRSPVRLPPHWGGEACNSRCALPPRSWTSLSSLARTFPQRRGEAHSAASRHGIGRRGSRVCDRWQEGSGRSAPRRVEGDRPHRRVRHRFGHLAPPCQDACRRSRVSPQGCGTPSVASRGCRRRDVAAPRLRRCRRPPVRRGDTALLRPRTTVGRRPPAGVRAGCTVTPNDHWAASVGMSERVGRDSDPLDDGDSVGRTLGRHRMWAMVVKEFRQVRRDRRTLAMLILMPVVLLVVFGYAASFDVGHVNVSLMGPAAESMSTQVPDRLVVDRIDPAGGRDEAVDLLRRGKVVAVVVTGGDSPTILVDGSELFAARAVVQAATLLQREMPGLTIEVLFNPTLDTSTVLVPGLGGLILLFVGTVITSLGVVRERQAGTLEQLAVMPLRPRDVFVGKVAPYFLVASVDLAVVLGVGVWLFDVPFRGSVATLLVGAFLFLFVTLGMGVLISSVSENQGQAIQLALMTLLPQVLLSGLIFPLSSMGPGVRWIGYLLPLTYFNQVARGVMVRGAPFDSLLVPLGLLAVLGALAFTLSVARFRGFLGAGEAHRGGGA